jgi:hypothetical protein
MYELVFLGYVGVLVTLFAVGLSVPRLRWPALTLATLGTVIPVLLAVVGFILVALALRDGNVHFG